MPDLTNDEAKRLAREAEMGYDLDTGYSVMRRLESETDAAVWAKCFKDQFGDRSPDLLTMQTWFAAAIGVG